MPEKKPCINNDGKTAVKRGMCNACYLRYVRSTPPAERAPIERLTDLERFYTHVNKMGPLAKNRPDLGRCHLWTDGTDQKGYGIFWADGTSNRAHIWIYKQSGGVIAEGHTIDHFACDRPPCVNRDHLLAGTHQANVLRSTGPAAINAAKTHCGVCGEPYDENNTRISGGRRYCLRCVRERGREARRAERAAISERIRLAPGSLECANGHSVTPESTFTYQRFPSCRICALAEGVTRAQPRAA